MLGYCFRCATMVKSTKISIGIIAHNEASSIREVLSDVLNQTALKSGKFSVEVLVIANGCTDNTAELTESFLCSARKPDNVEYRIIREEIPSKTNAWNVFVHKEQSTDSEYTVLMDADIRITQPKLIENFVEYLEDNEDTNVVLGESRKLFKTEGKPSPFRSIRKLLSGTITHGGPGFCGQLYCARASEIRKIVLPVGILSQDGFLRAMFLTSGLTTPERFNHIQVLPGCFHLHPDYASVSSLFRYEKRQAIGTAIYRIIYAKMNTMKASYAHRMAEIRQLNATDPDWVKALVSAKIESGERLISNRYIFRSVSAIRHRRGWRKLVSIPFVFLVLPFDMLVCWRAERELRSGSIGSLRGNTGKFKVRA